MPDYHFDYKGTLPLDFETFPEVPSPQWMIDEGMAKEGDVSNIITESWEMDGKHVLMPGMIGGEKSNINELLSENKHFGAYDTKEELDEADRLIHEWFKRLKGGRNVGMTTEDKIIDHLKEQ